MLKPLVDSIREFFKVVDAIRLLPSQCKFPDDVDIFSIAKLLIVALLFAVARLVVAGSTGSLTASVIITVFAVVIFFLVGLLVRFVTKTQAADAVSKRTAAFMFVYWALTLVVFDVTDVPLVLGQLRPLGVIIFGDLLLILGLEVSPTVLDLIRALALSLVVWICLGIKTRVQHRMPLLKSFTNWQFPVYVGVNSLLLLIFVLAPY